VHEQGRFLGELDLFSTQPVSRTALVLRPGEVLQVADDRMRQVLAADAHLRELVLRTFLVRRAMLIEFTAALRIIGRADSPATRRLQDYASTHHLTTDLIDLQTIPDGDRLLEELGASETDLPVVVSRTGRVLHNPNDAQLSQAVGALA
jgi:NhaA family Na+:H+ antiporter